jgi:hypothetical protein
MQGQIGTFCRAARRAAKLAAGMLVKGRKSRDLCGERRIDSRSRARSQWHSSDLGPQKGARGAKRKQKKQKGNSLAEHAEVAERRKERESVGAGA